MGECLLTRISQHRAVRADRNRQLGRPKPHLPYQVAGVPVSVRINQRVGNDVPSEEVLQAHEICRVASPEQDRSSTDFHKEGAPQDKGAHDGFADLSGTDDQVAQAYCVERHGLGTVGSSTSLHERRSARELTDLSGKFAGAVPYDPARVPQPVTSRYFDRASDHEVGRRTHLSDIEHDFVGSEISLLSREPPRGGDLSWSQHREHLLPASLE